MATLLLFGIGIVPLTVFGARVAKAAVHMQRASKARDGGLAPMRSGSVASGP